MPAQPSLQDMIAGLDPTGRTSISGAQLAQMITGATPNTGEGMCLVTTDTAGVPLVPDAATTTKWQSYLWIRVTATQAIPYVWNPTGANDPTYEKWQTVASASIGVGTIVNAMIADNTIQDGKIVSLSYSKLIGAPTGLPPSGAAGGDLTGTYPNPAVGNGTITTAKIANDAITHALLGAQAVQVPTDILPSGTGLAKIRTNAGATACEWALRDVLQIVQTSLTTKVNSSGNLANVTSTPNANATGSTNTGLSQAITPISAASTLLVEVTVPVSQDGTGSVFVGLYTATGANAPVAGAGMSNGSANVHATTVTFRYSVAPGSVTPITYYVFFGTNNGNAYVNSIDGTNVLFGKCSASIRIIEYI
jgi:hypothetical protein